MLIGHQTEYHPFRERPSYEALLELPFDERVERLRSASGTQQRPQAPNVGFGTADDLDDALDDLFENGGG